MSSFVPLRALAPAKINLGLFVGRVRQSDGRHELVSVMQSISLADELTLKPSLESTSDQLDCPGVEGPPEENLVMRALARFRQATGWDAGPVLLSVRKHVPVAAGLGGGSGDAAAALRLAAAASGLGEERMLLGLAAELGADIPAQVRPGRWLARGAGELLQELPSSNAALGVLVLPDVSALSTAAVYGELDRAGRLRSSAQLSDLAFSLNDALAEGQLLPPLELMGNDLEMPARSLCPSIAKSVARARSAGAEMSVLSGSGPTVVGIFAAEDGPARAQQAARELQERGVAAHAARSVEASYGMVGVVEP